MLLERPDVENVRQKYFTFLLCEICLKASTIVFITKFLRLQRGSADCTVLTATGLVNGEWQNLTPYKIETLETIDKKFGTFISLHDSIIESWSEICDC